MSLEFYIFRSYAYKRHQDEAVSTVRESVVFSLFLCFVSHPCALLLAPRLITSKLP